MMVSVEEAIRRGKRLLVVAPSIIFVGCMLAGIYFSAEINSGWPFFGGLACGIACGLLFWSFQITKWRIWAFGNVRNVHQLKKEAIENRLIHKDGGFLEKFEYATEFQRQELKRLQRKFEQPDVYHDDFSVPKETRIFHSKKAIAVHYVFSVGLFAGGAIAYYYDNTFLPAFLIMAVGIFLIVRTAQKNIDKKPQLIINDSWIELPQIGRISWDDIDEARIDLIHEGKYAYYYLRIFHDGKTDSVRLPELSLSPNRIAHCLRVYRLRSEKMRA